MATVVGVGEVSGFGLRANIVTFLEAQLLGWIPCEAHAERLRAAEVDDIVPPIRDGSLGGKSVVEPVVGPQSEVVERNRVVEQKTARVVQIVLRLDHFLAGRR